MGFIAHDRLLVSLAAPHFINGRMKEANKLSIRLVDEATLPKADYAGSMRVVKAQALRVSSASSARRMSMKNIGTKRDRLMIAV